MNIHNVLGSLKFFFFLLLNNYRGLPWWLSGKESACQCRRHQFNPDLGRSHMPQSNGAHVPQ